MPSLSPIRLSYASSAPTPTAPLISSSPVPAPYAGTVLSSPSDLSRLLQYLARTLQHPTWQRAVRESLGISQWTLARRLGITQNIVSRWEKYDYVPTLQTLLTWGDAISELEKEAEAQVRAQEQVQKQESGKVGA